MAKNKYFDIYKDLKNKIEEKIYPYQEFLPSEHILKEEYECSRNTIRRALADLSAEGYVQSRHGKGVIVIYQPYKKSEFVLAGTESFKESSIRNNKKYKTNVICIKELVVDEKIENKTTIPIGTEIYYLQRLRFLEDRAVIIDHNYFVKDVVKNLTKEIAEDSVYQYMREVLKENIVTTKGTFTVKKTTKMDKKYLGLNGFNCVAVLNIHAYNTNGVMFEFTESRHVPENFVFLFQAQKIKN